MNRKRIWLRVLVLFGAIVLVTIVGVGVWVFRLAVGAMKDLASGARSLPHELAAARRDGVPLETSDLRPDPPLPASRNAAPYIKKLGEVYWSQTESENRRTGEIMDAMASASRRDADRRAARDWLKQRSRIITLAEMAASKPDCDMAKAYEEGPYLKFPEFAGAREAARLLAIRATLESDEGRYREAFRDIALGARLGRHVGREPVLVAMLVRLAIENLMHRAFATILCDHADRADVIGMARATLPAFGNAPDIERAFGGEVVMGRVMVDMLRTGKDIKTVTGTDAPEAASRALSSRGSARLFYGASEARIVNYWRHVYARLRQHPGDYVALGSALRDLDREMQEKARASAPSYILIAILAPTVTKVADRVAHNEAQRRMREGLVRIAEYRLRTGRFPQTLAEAGGSPLKDPFTGKPLQYRRTPKGFLLYSVGENCIDDGGNGRRPPEGGSAPDIVIEYPPTGNGTASVLPKPLSGAFRIGDPAMC